MSDSNRRTVVVLELFVGNRRKAFVEGLGVTINMLAIHWSVAGSFLGVESGALYRFVPQRSLPSNLLARLFFIWLMPGPGTGYAFAVLSMLGPVWQ